MKTLQKIRCQLGNSLSFYLEMSCDLPDDMDAVEFCAMPLVKVQAKTANSSIDFNYVIDYDEICPRILENVKVVKSKVGEYLILYGCTNYATEHEEGAWILGSKSSVTEPLKRLDEAFSFLKNSSAKIKDFKVYEELKENLTGVEVSWKLEEIFTKKINQLRNSFKLKEALK